MNINRVLTTVDTHTAGGPTRIVIGGIPPLEGETVADKMEYFHTHFDSLRKLLMLEPRGHRAMSGAVLTVSDKPTAAIGAFFMTSAGYLRACVHSSIGLVTAGLETGFLSRPASRTEEVIKMEVPAGVVSLIPHYQNGKLASVAIRMPPAFVFSPAEQLSLDSGGTLQAALAYSGVFFVLVNAKELAMLDCPIAPGSVKQLREMGMEILAAANRQIKVNHPENAAITSCDLVMIYEDLGTCHARDIVIGPTGTIDRSPCGAGTGAMMTYLFSQGGLQVGEEYVLESFLGTQFIGKIVKPAQVGSYVGAVPEIEGTAYITGMHQFVLEEEDPLIEGIVV